MSNTGIRTSLTLIAFVLMVSNIGLFWTCLTLICCAVIMKITNAYSQPIIRPIIKEGFWGRGSRKDDDESITPFSVQTSEEDLKDLEKRLQNVRLSDDLEDTQFQYGFQSKYMKEVVNYWLNQYKWKEQEIKLNSFPQSKTQIEGIDVHFLRIKPEESAKTKEASIKSKVLLLVHGWPGSIHEFHKIIPILTNPTKYGGHAEDAFEVICPSIPGYGFSEAPHKQGFDCVAAARVFVKLMKRLGHDKFYCQAGDWGSVIVRNIATMYPLNVLGLHVNLAPVSMISTKPLDLIQILIGTLFPSLVLPKPQQKIYPLSMMFKNMLQETGYFHIQSTKPDTVGTGLNDSPVGLAAYILEKFSTGTNIDYRELPDGGLTKHFTLDELLTNVMIYWLTGSITSSCRFYKEIIISKEQPLWTKVPIHVPSGVACFPNELIHYTPEKFLHDKMPNLIHYSDNISSGGHFAAFEEPQVLAEDLWKFIRKAEVFHEFISN